MNCQHWVGCIACCNLLGCLRTLWWPWRGSGRHLGKATGTAGPGRWEEMKALLLLPLMACLALKVRSKIYSRCELAQTLKRWGMDGHEGYSLANWICLAYFASGFNTETVMHNSDGSSEYGIFQINSRSWCADRHTLSKNLCSLSCFDLLTEEIIDDIICLKRATAEPEGLADWYGWRDHCRGRDLSYWVAACNL
ncbi:lysozyme C, milk isozyme-like isoform X2 [Podarcis raffonei]|uniref:lysozyme C, milk isozyme-like isoform X2 n=1 Tax=Podarcis raffonei TaxID=65483 RepID=UPI0023298CB9|nr:lysozyme C, milk isozyme-like isoform X2 [Podarcis raffonei]